jgi:hypothetical protein
MSHRTIAILGCLSLAVAAGSLAAAPGAAQAAREKAYPVETAVKDGVKTITNPDYPRDGRFTARLTEEISCGGEGAPEAAILNVPIRLVVDDEGALYVVDLRDVNFKVYGSDGSFLRTMGRRGQGPGEFGGMFLAALMSGGRLAVLDGAQHRVFILTTGGQYLSGFPLEGYFRDIAVDGKDGIYLAKWGAVKEPDGLSSDFREIPYVTSIYRTDASGKALVHLTDFLGETMAMKSAGGGAVVYTGGLYTIVWTIDPDGRIYGGYNENYSLGVYGTDGKPLMAFGRRFTPVKNPRFRGQPGMRKTMPAFQTIVLDEGGNLWVDVVQDGDAEGRVYDVFSPAGIYLKQVATACRASSFKGGKLYSIDRPADGFPSVKRFAMELVPAEK